jgi:DHA2 family multidrug resistance protein
MPLVGYLLGKRWDARWMLVFGFVVMSLAFFGYSTMNLSSGTWDIFLHQINQGVGQTFLFLPLTILTMDPIPKEDTGYATSLYSVMRNIGSSMGISFVTTWVARRSQFHQDRLSADVSVFNPLTQQAIDQARQMFMRGGADWATATQRATASLYGAMQQQAALLSFVDVFYLMAFLFIVLVPLVLLMRKPAHGQNASLDMH